MMTNRPLPTAPTTITPQVIDLGDNLAVAVFRHTISSQQEGVIPCISYVSEGLAKFGQDEVVFTVKANAPVTNAPPGIDFPTEPVNFIRTIQSYAKQNQLVYHGDWTEFSAASWLGRNDYKKLVYHRNLLLGTLTENQLPRERLHAIALIDAENQVASRYGVLRILTHLGRVHRHFPVPPWIDPQRMPAVTLGELQGTILDSCRAWYHQGITCSKRGNNLNLTIGTRSKEPLMKFLNTLKPTDVFCLSLNLEHGSDSCLTWKKADTQPIAISAGQSADQMGLVFLIFCPEQQTDELRMLEDGYIAMMKNTSWAACRKALETGQSMGFSEDQGQTFLNIDFVAETYRSVDGTVYAPSSGFKSYHPDNGAKDPKADGPVQLQHIVLLRQPANAQDANVDGISAYITAVHELVKNEYKKRPKMKEAKAMIIKVDFDLKGKKKVQILGNGLRKDDGKAVTNGIDKIKLAYVVKDTCVEIHINIDPSVPMK